MDDKQDWESPYLLDRERGILTPEDRKYLFGEKEYKHPESARNRRAKIRQRVRNSLLDFVVLKYLEPRDREQIFNTDDPEIPGGLSSAFIFLYDALVRSKEDNVNVDLNLNVYIEQAVQIADQERGYRSEVSVEIDREELDDPATIFERAKREGFSTLTGPEMDLLWYSDEVDPAAFASFMNQLFPDDDEEIKASHILKERQGMQEVQEELDRKR